MTKDKELSMNQTFRQFMDAGLGLGSADVLNDIVNDKIMGFGTTIDEKIFNLDELKALIARQKEQSKDIDLSWEIKPLSHYTSPDENTAFFADELLLHATIGGESIEMYLRFSVVLSYVKNEWKVIHWHGSKPENVQSEKDTWGIETWKEKAEALEKLVEERTADLKEKNRELEIEASLERIRSTAMGMQQPEDLLKIAETLFKELQAIGLQGFRNALIHTYNDEEKYFTDYDYSEFTGGCISRIPYSGHPAIDKFIKEVRSTSDAFTEIVITGKELEDWREFRKSNNEAPDTRLDENSALYYYFYSVGPADIGISTFTSISDQERELLKRYRNVFDLAYRRYLDIEQAVAQTREAQIEAAVERVRGKALAMQKSEDLHSVVVALKKALAGLKIPGVTAVSMYLEQDDGSIRGLDLSSATAGEEDDSAFKMDVVFRLEDTDPDLWIRRIWNGNEKYFVVEANEADFGRIVKWLNTIDEKEAAVAERIIKDEAIKKAWLPTVKLEKGKLNIDLLQPPDQEIESILIKIGAAFDLAYRRFLDLQKAEAQAREAQIELALERVRARTMAMHKSEEVMDVAGTLFQELKKLGFAFGASSIIIMDNKSGDAEYWMAGFSKEKFPESYRVKYFKHIYHDALLSAWKTGKKYIVYDLAGDEKKTYDEVLFSQTGYKNIPEEEQKLMRGIESVTFSIAFMKHGALHWGPTLLNEEQAHVLQRFAKVFEQSYTRFLDLQKAEAQAREAQIESALERVRSRSLAMHHTLEIQSVIHAVHDELLKLNISIFGGSFIVINKDVDEGLYAWGAGATAETTTKVLVPHFGMPFCTNLIEGIKTGSGFFTEEFSAQQKISYFTKLFNQEPWSEIPDADKKNILESDSAYTRSVSVLDNTSIFIVNQNGRKFSTEENEILRRFSKVFEQSYTRFLDLQKAEAQARESQIEAAVERVRAQSMAMHHADDLNNVNKEILTQLNWLQIQGLSGVTFYLVDEDGWVKAWDFASPGNIGDQISYTYQFDFNRYEMIGYPFKMLQQTDLDYFVADFPLEKIQKAVFEFEEIDPTIATIVKEALSTGVLTHQWTACARISNGMLGIDLVSPPNEDTKAIVLKMAGAFNQAYTRFLDLQKAEAQAREAQINLAVERVRARALAMFKSEEILEVVFKLKEEVMNLNIPNVMAATIHMIEKNGKHRMWDISSMEAIEGKLHLPLDISFRLEETDPNFFIRRVWTNTEKYFLVTQDEKDLKRTTQWLKDNGKTKEADETVEFINATQLKKLYHPTIQLNSGRMCIDLLEEPSGEIESILTKMGAAFDLAYKRFEDLQNSEDQLKEAKIEAALEKVRSRSLAMHSSQELGDVIAVVLEKLQELGFVIDSGAAAHINIFSEGTRDFIQWSAAPDQAAPVCSKVPYTDNNLLSDFFDAKEKGLDFFAKTYSFEEKNTWFDYAFEHSDFKYLPDDLKKVLLESKDYAHWMAIEKNSCIVINSVSGNTLSQNQIEIQKRFAKVFEQSYVRFLDLQKAEAQAREAQIQLALERVRAKTMAMQKSDELSSIAKAMYDQLRGLGLELEDGIIIMVFKENSHDQLQWPVFDGGVASNKMFVVPYFDHPVMNEVYKARESGEKFIERHFDLKTKDSFLEKIFSVSDHRYAPEEFKSRCYAGSYYHYSFAMETFTGILMHSLSRESYPDEHNEIIRRFTRVFEQAYVRFLDLQKAEAQTKEAQIELSLERIRAKVTAMQRSSDLLDIVVTMRREFVSLGHEAHYFWHMRWLPDKYEKAMTSGDGSKIGMVMQLPRHIHGDIKLLADWEATDEPTVVMAMDGETAAGYVHKMISLGDFEQVDPNAPTLDDIRNIGGLTFIMSRTTHGEIGYSLPGVVANPPAEDLATLVRFAAVFDLAYRRFEDLQSSEKRIREAQIELAIERVRAQTLAMHKSDELANLSLELVKQVQTLGVNTWFCAFNIYDEDSQGSMEWGSNGQGTFPKYRTPREGVFLRYFEAGQRGETLLINEIGKDECSAHYEYLCTLPGVGEQLLKMKEEGISFPTYQIDHVAFFKYGYIIFITYEPVPESHDIFKRFAKVFEQTYTRFLDLQKAEAQAVRAEKDLVEIKAARKKAEEALTDLRATQKQLVQSEKMASLGELTAGIAHEIQNPLNFVNNFSEVSKELLDEMKDALENGDTQEAKEIAGDIIQNLEKITHHGKRADAIVKGMLQHSRASSNQKETTDINALTDEYLRLAYHGLRAKDKSFNATLKTEYDENIGTISIVPQDMGRVILNLITNAFYAVTEKKKQIPDNYEPTVFLSTKKMGDKVEIRVSDNGSGIPQNIVDKIFQPFFTTKPTGQGTGLGLSLAYDIIKAHGGELKVETEGNMGTKFIIQLPYSTKE